jgi:hypothetical protein
MYIFYFKNSNFFRLIEVSHLIDIFLFNLYSLLFNVIHVHILLKARLHYQIYDSTNFWREFASQIILCNFK